MRFPGKKFLEAPIQHRYVNGVRQEEPMAITQHIAHAAGRDAGNRSMRNAGRKSWNEDDWNTACRVERQLLIDARLIPEDAD